MRSNLVGKRYGLLTVIKDANDIVYKNGDHQRSFICKCDCGNIANVRYTNLVNGLTKSCGCYRRKMIGNMFRKHGGHEDRLYVVWERMNSRCNAITDKHYPDYGGRGISVCSEWLEYKNFREWALSNGYDESLPKGECTLDRIDVNGNYEPTNCRWVSMKTQSRNKRKTVKLTFNGETKPMADWAEQLGLNYEMVRWRIKYGGWSVEEALTKPKNGKPIKERKRNKLGQFV